MNTKYPVLTLDVLDGILQAVPSEARNPQENAPFPTCVYTNREGAHCLVGHVLATVGFPCPEHGDNDNTTSIGEWLDETELYDNLGPGVAEALEKLQDRADRPEHDYPVGQPPRLWGAVVAEWENSLYPALDLRVRQDAAMRGEVA